MKMCTCVSRRYPRKCKGYVQCSTDQLARIGGKGMVVARTKLNAKEPYQPNNNFGIHVGWQSNGRYADLPISG